MIFVTYTPYDFKQHPYSKPETMMCCKFGNIQLLRRLFRKKFKNGHPKKDYVERKYQFLLIKIITKLIAINKKKMKIMLKNKNYERK